MSDRAGFPDLVQPFRIENANVRGRLVRLGPAYAEALDRHDYPETVGELLGETLAMSAALAASLKYDGIFTLQAQGNGPVGMIVADVTSEGHLRAYARISEDDGAYEAAADPAARGSVPRLIGSGHLAFTVDQGPDTDRYQGITPLEGATLTDCAHTYFRQSEQLDTAIMIGAHAGGNGGAPRASALMIQRLPGDPLPDLPDEEAEERWRRSVILMSSLTTDEMLNPSLHHRDLLFRLFHEDGVRVYGTRPLELRCRCSREKVASVLARFRPDELGDMRAEDGRLVATCEFCRTDYFFDDEDLAELQSA